MIKEEDILNKHVTLYFSSHHDKSRWNGEGENGGAEWHTDKAIAADIYKAIDEYAKQQAIEFDKWKKENLWAAPYDSNVYIKYMIASSEGVAFEQKTFEDLYNLFIEQQNKP